MGKGKEKDSPEYNICYYWTKKGESEKRLNQDRDLSFPELVKNNQEAQLWKIVKGERLNILVFIQFAPWSEFSSVLV